MRPKFAWDRASARSHPRVLPISLLAVAIAATLSACGDSATAPSQASPDQKLRESQAFTVAGITYPTVSIQGVNEQIAVGAHETIKSKLATPTATWMGAYMTYTSSDPSVVSISTANWGNSSGDQAYLTGVKAGTATVTAKTMSGTVGSATITVGTPVASGPGGTHEPAGMSAQINTGAMTAAPATSYPANTWREGGTTFANYSPTSMSSTGEWSGNLSAVPGGSGIRVAYGPSLAGGNSPVRFGTSIPNQGSGDLYVRWNYRLSPNWTLSRASGLKVMEPRTVNSTENHVIGVGADGQSPNGSNMWLGVLLQFATGGGTQGINLPGNSQGQVTNPLQAFVSSVANVGGSARGSWHTMEVYFHHESPAGANNGQLTLWVDGAQVYQNSSVHFFQRGESMGWNFLMFDPTYGGDQASDHPPYDIYWDIDQLYVSTR